MTTTELEIETNMLRAHNEQLEAFLYERKRNRRLQQRAVKKQVSHPGCRAFIRIVADHFGVTEEAIVCKSRIEKFVVPRQAAMDLMYELLAISSNEVGLAFNGRDHATVLHARKANRDRMETDPRLKAKIEALKERLKNTDFSTPALAPILEGKI